MFISKNNSVKQVGIFIDDKFLTKANKSFYYLRVKMNIQNVLLWPECRRRDVCATNAAHFPRRHPPGHFPARTIPSPPRTFAPAVKA